MIVEDRPHEHEALGIEERFDAWPCLRCELDHVDIARVYLLTIAERGSHTALLVIEKRCREPAALHRFQLIAGDVAIALERVDHVSIRAVESLIADDLATAKRGRVQLDERSSLVRLLLIQLDRPFRSPIGVGEGDRSVRDPRRDLAQRRTPSRRRQVLFDDLVRGLREAGNRPTASAPPLR